MNTLWSGKASLRFDQLSIACAVLIVLLWCLFVPFAASADMTSRNAIGALAWGGGIMMFGTPVVALIGLVLGGVSLHRKVGNAAIALAGLVLNALFLLAAAGLFLLALVGG
jgi:hypothetical protein